MLEDKTNWPYYSAALVKIQRDFVRERPIQRKRPDSIGEVLAQDVHSTEW